MPLTATTYSALLNKEILVLLFFFNHFNRGFFYKTSSYHCVMPQEMRWKHQPQDLFWPHPTGAQEKLAFQKAGGQQDHSW